MRKHRLIFVYAFVIGIATGFVSCSDDPDALPLESPAITTVAHSPNSLSFTWGKIENAVQYGYQLVGPNGEVVYTGVVNTPTTIDFTGLQPNTTYTFNVWAFAAMNGDYTTPPQVSLTATTDGMVILDVPADVTLVSSSDDSFEFSWSPVENAEAYTYKITGNNETITKSVTATSVVVSDLDAGNYEFSVSATTTVSGYQDSEYSQPVLFASTRNKLWSVTGIYYSYILDSEWDATMVAYDDGTYSIRAWYGVEGYNFKFSIDNSGEYGPFQMGCGTFDSTSWLYAVETGRSDIPTIDVYPYYDYSYLSGNKNAGKVNINYYNSSTDTYVNDSFTWGTSQSIDVITGSYQNILTGWELLFDNDNNSYWAEINTTVNVTITKVDDETVSIDGLMTSGYYGEYPLEAKVDMANMTLKITPTSENYGWYTFAGDNSATESVIGTINEDMSIVFRNFNLWYYFDNGGWSYYLSDMKAVLVKQ